MQKFSAAAFQALTADQCDQILASIRTGDRCRVFSWNDRASQHVIDGEIYDGEIYLVQPSEWLVAQRLGFSLRATIIIVLWCALMGILSLPLLVVLPVWGICIVRIARLLAVNLIGGGYDVTDAVLVHLRRKLHAFAGDQDARDFFDDLAQRPSPD